MKRQLIAASLLMAASSFQFANADGTITFNGAISSETCNVMVNGVSAAPTVTLPKVSMSGLNTAAGMTKGATNMVFTMQGCTGTATSVQAYFEGGPALNVTADGYVANTTTVGNGGAGGVGLQINDSVGTKVFIGNQTSQANGATAPISVANGGTIAYTVQYVSLPSTMVTAGLFNGSVVYSMVYQ